MIIDKITLGGIEYPIVFTNGAIIRVERLTGKKFDLLLNEMTSGEISMEDFTSLTQSGISAGITLASRPMSGYGSAQLPEVPEFMELADMMCFVTDIKLVVEILIKYLPKADPNSDAEKNEAGPTAIPARKTGKK